MKASRVFNILMLLLEKRSVTSAELAERFGVSVRTVFRDIDILERAGIPLYTTTGKSGGIHLMDGFVIDKSLFTQQEQTEIMTYLPSISDIPLVDTELIRSKLSVVFSRTAESELPWLDIRFSGGEGGENGGAIFKTIKQAILGKNVLIIDYINAKGEALPRRVEPAKLVFRHNSWYLWAYCITRKAYRWFKITRIISIRVTPERQSQNHAMAQDKAIENPSRQHELTHLELRFPKMVAHLVYDMFDKENIQTCGEDSIGVSMEYEMDEWIFRILMIFGANVQVLEPQALREQLADIHKRAYEQLSQGGLDQ